MATVSPAGNQATNLLQKLSLDSQAKSFEVPETTKRMNTKSPSAIKYGLGGGEVPSGRIPSSERSTTPSIPDFVDPSMCYHPNGFPSTTYYYGGYDGPMNEWEEYSRYVNPEGVEIPPTGVYGDNGSLMYHHGYGYAPYGGYPSTGSPVPTIGHDGQLYGPQHYQYPTPYYQPSTPSGTQYVHHQGAIPQAEVSTSVAADQVSLPVGKGSGNVNGNENVNGTSGPLPLRSSYLNSSQASNGSHGKGVFKGGVSVSRHQDPKFGFDGTRSSAPWSDGSILSNGHQRTTTSSSLVSTVPSSRNQNPRSLPHLMGFHPRPAGVSPALGFMSGLYPNNRMYSQSGDLVRTSPGIALDSFDPRTNGRGWLFADKYKPRGRGNGFFGYGNESAEGLNELNRGPRAGRFKNQKGIVPTITLAVKGQSISSNGSNDRHGMVPDRDQYNRAEFPIKYSDAKFFIIKSYSEDDIHRSIKYGVWASTPNGNKKLDVAYREAQEKSSGCPVFLFFSVNTSGQFIGIGEMDGPVDFNKNLEYWQQDKWTGCFPVKWHIVKDVPNNSLKHITLENNDNKPVTNSRDTQEVKFEQGMEMLKIFKDHVHKTSILDDFVFYEARQKTTQERKAKSLQFQKQLLDKKSANASGSERDKDGLTLEPMLQKPLELPSVLKKEAEKGLENQEVFKESGLVVGAGDVNGAKSAVEKRVVDNGITNNVC